MKQLGIVLAAIFTAIMSDAQQRNDIIITEIMADPAPPVALPEYEWIELRNNTHAAISLAGWRIGDAVSQSGPLPAFILQPDSFVIVCANSSLSALSTFGRAIPVTSFPSLDNSNDLVILKAPNSSVIHAVNYSSTWYNSALKREGGWSLEMIDITKPCTNEINWSASQDFSGGTPGKINSINGSIEDHTPLDLLRTYTIDSVTIVAVFNKPVDSSTSSQNNLFELGTIPVQSAIAQPPMFNEILIKLNSPMQPSVIYTLQVAGISDCYGNSISSKNRSKAALPFNADSNLIINEILFNPRPSGYDYIELYNKGQYPFDLRNVHIANRNSAGIISSIRRISGQPFLIFPGEHIVVTDDLQSLQLNYFIKDPHSIVETPLPSFPDENGTVIILDHAGLIIDEVNYNEDWHFKLIDDLEGISLERLHPDTESNRSDNWHSASSTSGFGTPGYENSQQARVVVNSMIDVSPPVFSPDNDGYNDITTINYAFDEPGYMCTLTIYTSTFTPIRWLVKNQLLGLKGSWTWNGLDEKGNKLPVGIYIFFVEIFNLNGKTQRFKETIVLARKLNAP